jgi:hypothetical protein
MRSFIFISIPKYHWADKLKENEVGGARGKHGRGEKIVQSFGGNARRKRSLGRARRRWEDWIRMDLMEIGLVGGGYVE